MSERPMRMGAALLNGQPVPQYPWNIGDILYASALNAAIANNMGAAGAQGPVGPPGPAGDPQWQAGVVTSLSPRVLLGGGMLDVQQTWLAGPVSYIGTGLTLQNGVLSAPGPAGAPAGMLPTAGGTMTGPLNYTATGGTTVRSAQDRAADVANVLDFGAAPNNTGVDSTPAFVAALATGKDVYAPMGTYSIRNQIVVGQGQQLYGDGRAATTLYITSSFSASAASVISLSGVEQQSPTVRDLTILFQQPTTIASRASMLTLAGGGTSGPGGTGVMYPPAILTNASNRFRILNLSVWGAWDGIINPAAHNIGGFIIENIEMGALNRGLSLDNCLDFGHIKCYHFWCFGLNVGATYNVFADGNTFAAQFGANGQLNGLTVSDFTSAGGRVSVATLGTWIHFTSLMLDGANSRLEVASCSWVLVTNAYCTGSGAIANSQIVMGGGNLFIANLMANTSTSQPVITQTGGRLMVTNSLIGQQSNSVPAISQSGGFLEIAGNVFAASVSAAWTQPFISVTSGATACSLSGNRMDSVSIGDVGLLSIATDSAQHSVRGNFWNGWHWTPPGTLGDYGLNSDGYTSKNVVFANLGTGSNTGPGSGVTVNGAAASNRQLKIATAGVNRWSLYGDNSGEGGGNAGTNLILQSYTDAGAPLVQPLTINRATGAITLGSVLADGTTSFHAATSGFNVTIPNGCNRYLIAPAGTLASGTATMPAAPVQNQIVIFTTSQAVTSFTLSPNAGQTLLGAPTTLAANTSIQYLYNGTTWYRER